MNHIKLTLTVNVDEGGENLIGLLAKGLGRGELGIVDLRLEPEPNVAPRAFTKSVAAFAGIVAAQRQSKKVAAALAAPKRKGSTRRGRVATDKGMAKVVLDLFKQEASPIQRPAIIRALEANNFRGSSANGLIDRLKRAEIIRHGGDGYTLTESYHAG